MAERKITRFVKGHKRTEYVKAKSARNEGLDLLTYNLAMAHYLGMNRYSVNDWARLRQAVSQASLFADPVATVPSAADEADEHEPQGEAPSAPVRPAPPARSANPPSQPTGRRTSRSGYLSRR
ncbi:Phage terminase, large subunit [Pseudomonas aeruginosa]|nr:Phage terminase, large subunit [Pseudomonas aeruginosa]